MSSGEPQVNPTAKSKAQRKPSSRDAVMEFRRSLKAPRKTGQPVADLGLHCDALIKGIAAATGTAAEQARSPDARSPEEFRRAVRQFHEPLMESAIVKVRTAGRAKGAIVYAEVRELTERLSKAIDVLFHLWEMDTIELYRHGTSPVAAQAEIRSILRELQLTLPRPTVPTRLKRSVAKQASLTPLAERVGQLLRGKRLKSDAIAKALGARADAVRRAISELRNSGMDIHRTPQGYIRLDALPPV